MPRPSGKHRVLHREYREAFDLTGRDLISLLDHSKAQVSALIGPMVGKESMSAVALPVESVTSMAGEIADEVHEWPRVTLGPRLRHLVLHFLDDRLVGFRWSFPPSPGGAATRKPWYRRLMGR
jgi:hypothetical protein